MYEKSARNKAGSCPCSTSRSGVDGVVGGRSFSSHFPWQVIMQARINTGRLNMFLFQNAART